MFSSCLLQDCCMWERVYHSWCQFPHTSKEIICTSCRYHIKHPNFETLENNSIHLTNKNSLGKIKRYSILKFTHYEILKWRSRKNVWAHHWKWHYILYLYLYRSIPLFIMFIQVHFGISISPFRYFNTPIPVHSCKFPCISVFP